MNTERMTAAEVAEIEARANAATPGPWEPHRVGNADGTPAEGEQIVEQLESMIGKTIKHEDFQRNAYMVTAGTTPEIGEPDPDDFVLTSFTGNGPTSHINADFIAAARTDIPRLCAELRVAWAERDRAEKMLIDVLNGTVSDAAALVAIAAWDKEKRDASKTS